MMFKTHLAFGFLVLLLILSGCVRKPVDNVSVAENKIAVEDVSSEPEVSMWFREQIYDCDRFRPIFLREMKKYPLLQESLSLPMLYSMIFQESGCKTSDELEVIFSELNDTRETWKGGMMQVDSCWRCTDHCADCSSVDLQIMHGMQVLNSAFMRIDGMISERGLEFSAEDKVRLLLVAYNRGYTVIEHALDIYGEDLFEVFVNCTEKNLCTNDLEYVSINSSYSDDDLVMALLAGCRMEYGFMADGQGDYCTGDGYGLNYPEDVFEIYDTIMEVGDGFDQTFSVPTREKEVYIREIDFSNYSWFVKTSIGKAGPGPNYFYYNRSSTFVDSDGRLNLGIINDGERWYASEVVLTEPLGYGRYRFVLEGDLSDLDPDVVLGLFTYDLSLVNEEEHYHREIDFEISRWGDASSADTQFVIQAPIYRKPIKRFELENRGELVVVIDWQPDSVKWELQDLNGSVIESMNYTGPSVPVAGDERTRINLWLYDGGVPEDDVEIVVKEFSYTK